MNNLDLRAIVSLSWFITVLSMWVPKSIKTQFMKENEILIPRILSIISLVLLMYYLYLS